MQQFSPVDVKQVLTYELGSAAVKAGLENIHHESDTSAPQPRLESDGATVTRA